MFRLSVSSVLIGAAIGLALMVMPHGSGVVLPDPTPAPIRISPEAGPDAVPSAAPVRVVAATVEPTHTPTAVSSGYTISHRERAEDMAFRAISDAANKLSACEDDESAAEDCTAFHDFLSGAALYGYAYNEPWSPGLFTGIVWSCGADELCYAGLLVDHGSRLVTGITTPSV